MSEPSALMKIVIAEVAHSASMVAVLDVIEEMCEATFTDRVGTHYEGCWKIHAECLARLIVELIKEET